MDLTSKRAVSARLSVKVYEMRACRWGGECLKMWKREKGEEGEENEEVEK